MRRLPLLAAIATAGCGDTRSGEVRSAEPIELRDQAGHPHGVPVIRIDVAGNGGIRWEGRPLTDAQLAALLSRAEPLNPDPAFDIRFADGVAPAREQAIMRLFGRTPSRSVAVFRGGRLARPASN